MAKRTTKTRQTKKTSPSQESQEKTEPAGVIGPTIRNVGIRRVKVTDIVDNPLNFRTHDLIQADALDATVDEIGWYGYPDVYEDPDHPGQVVLIDGELRKHRLITKYGEDAEIDVNVTDFDGLEASKALASKDPLAAMAGTAKDKLKELLDALRGSTDGAFRNTLEAIAEMESVALDGLVPEFEPDPDGQGRLDEKKSVECPECGHTFVP